MAGSRPPDLAAIEPFRDPEVERRIDEQLIHRSPSLEIGRFRARPGDRRFEDSGPPGRYLIVFPRHAVRISHGNRPDYVGTSATASFYNPEDRYRRSVISPAGDHSDWFALPGSVVREALRSRGREASGRESRLFDVPCAPVSRELHLLARVLVSEARSGTADPDGLEERAHLLLDGVIGGAIGGARGGAIEGARGAAKDDRRGGGAPCVEGALAVLAERFAEQLPLAVLADELGCSVYQLCRRFRAETGRTIHAHRTRLRLRRAVDLILDGAWGRLADVAVEVGFSHHSHFAQVFRRHYGFPPSALEDRASRDRLAAERVAGGR